VAQWLAVEADRAGRVITDDRCRVAADVYVIGDCAHFPMPPGQELPGVAQTAMQQGAYVARLIKDLPSGPFVYQNIGALATIGRKAAVAQFERLQFSGFFAWLMWMGIHLWNLLGIRRKGLVFIQWAWAYVTYRRGARLITRHDR
jgi:NADH dehydrogenase